MVVDKKYRLNISLTALKNYAIEQGYWPSLREWNTYARENGYYQFQGIHYHTKKSWETLRKEYGFPPKQKKYSKEDGIAALLQAAEKYGPAIKRKEYNEWRKNHPNTPTSAQLVTMFGSYTNAKIEAGLVTNKIGGKTFTNEEIIFALKKCAEEIGEKFSESQYEKWRKGRKNIPNIETIRKRFGSAVEARKKLGLDAFESGPQYKYNDQKWQTPFMSFLREVLSSRNYARWAKRNNAPSLKAIRDNAGSYSNALEKMLEIYLKINKQ